MLRHVPRSSNSGKEISASVIADNSTVYDESGAGTATLALLEDAQEYNRWIVDFFRRYLGETNFELGAGRGTLSAIVAETHRVIPFEISEVNNALVRKRFASHSFVEPCRSDILASTDFGTVDCVYSANVLEHIEEDLVVIQHCARLLRVGGWFVAFAPAGQWLYSMFDREHGHIRRYTAADRTRLTEPSSGGAKLALREFRHVNLLGAFGWFVKMRVFGHTKISKGDAAAVGRLMPLIKLMDRLHLPVGQSVVMAWQRLK